MPDTYLTPILTPIYVPYDTYLTYLSAPVRAKSLDSYLRNVGQNDCKKIYPAKAPRRKVENIFLVLRTWRLCAFARVISFPIL